MKKALSLLVCAALLLSLIPAGACAEEINTLFTDRDWEQSPDLSHAVTIQLLGNTASGNNVQIQGNTVTIQKEGIYVLEGELDGQIVVDASKSDKIQLVLRGAKIVSTNNAAIYVKQADKVFLTLAGESENVLGNSGSYEAADEKVDAVVYSKADLTLNGTGSVVITADSGNGIVSKDSLAATGGSWAIHAAEHGMTGKDSIEIAGGVFFIESGEDGIHAKNSDDAALGFLYIGGGCFEIQSGDDGISATGAIQIDGGDFTITSGGGSEAVEMKKSDAFSGGRFWEQNTQSTSKSSAKGIQSDRSITVKGGSFQLDCADDAVHCAEDLSVSGGIWEIRTADDGMHSDSNVVIDAGTISIPYCYEGIEGETVTVNGGTIDITATDDGLNAAGGADNSGFWGGFPGGNSNASITINGGSITVKSDGDCLDSNGVLVLNGGKLDLTCGGYGNTAIDYESGFENNGADVTTNDGSENGTEMRGFGHGHMGGDIGRWGNRNMPQQGGEGQMDRPQWNGEGQMNPPQWNGQEEPQFGNPDEFRQKESNPGEMIAPPGNYR